jgi:hypothetical protein
VILFGMKNVSAGKLFILALAVALPPAGLRAAVFHAGLSDLRFDVIPGCRVPDGAVAHSDGRGLPAPLTDAIKQKLGYLVPPNVPFDATDVVRTGHNRRLIFIWNRGDVWVVATEHGGIGYNDPILAYKLDSKGFQARLIAERVAAPKTVCSTSQELLNQQNTGSHAP